MTTLFDTLQAKLTDQPAPLVAPEQQTIQNALLAKTGKDVGSNVPAASTTGEQSAIATADNNIAQQQQSAKIQGTQIAQTGAALDTAQSDAVAKQKSDQSNATTALATQGQDALSSTTSQEQQGLQNDAFTEAQKVESINAAADQKARDMASQQGVSLDNIWRSFDQSNKDLANRKDAAQIEQVGFVLSMRDKAYVNELNRIGQARDLSDKLNYQDEMNDVMLGADLNKTMVQINFQQALNADNRTWETKLSQIDINAAIMFAQVTITQDSRNTQAAGVNKGLAAGMTYAATPSAKSTGDSNLDSQFQDDGLGGSSSINSNGSLSNGGSTPDFGANGATGADASQGIDNSNVS